MDWFIYYNYRRFIIFKKQKIKIIATIPLLTILIIFGFFLYILIQGKDPSIPTSALLNKKLPNFQTINLLDENQIFNKQKLLGKKVLINFFSSWCEPCKLEHSQLMSISKNQPGLFVLGINYKDEKEDAIKFINDLGNPYDIIGIDNTGQIGMDFGVYGLPETFIVNEEGLIIYKHVD